MTSQEDTVTSLDSEIDLEIDRQALALGAHIRELRLARGLTLVRLAAVAELSHPFLSQLERGRARPSMVSLEKIARALGTSQLELMAGTTDESTDDPVQPATVLVRADEGSRGPYGGGEGRLLVNGQRRFHPMEFEGFNLDPGDYFSHAEDEFVHVVAGTAVIDLADHGVHTLTAGDSLYYDGGVPHRWSAVDAGGYRLFVVKERPTRR